MIDWKPISERPAWDIAPYRQFIRLEGQKTHDGATWNRVWFYVAIVDNSIGNYCGYRGEDICKALIDGDMDFFNYRVTHWAPADFEFQKCQERLADGLDDYLDSLRFEIICSQN